MMNIDDDEGGIPKQIKKYKEYPAGYVDHGEGDEFDKPCKYTPEQIKEQEDYRNQLIADGRLKPDPEGGWGAEMERREDEREEKRQAKKLFGKGILVPYAGWIPGIDRDCKMMFPPRPIMYQGVSIAEGDYYIREVGHYDKFYTQAEYFLHIKKSILKELRKK